MTLPKRTLIVTLLWLIAGCGESDRQSVREPVQGPIQSIADDAQAAKAQARDAVSVAEEAAQRADERARAALQAN